MRPRNVLAVAARNMLAVSFVLVVAAVSLISVLGWPGIPTFSKIGYIGLFMLPVGALVVFNHPPRPRRYRTLTSVVFGIGFAAFVVIYVLLVSRHFRDFYPLDPITQLLDQGVNPDSAFHIALIRSITQVGYPSVGLDGYVPHGIYHFLGHYVDAGVFLLLGIDIVAGFGFAFFVKSAALVILMAKFVDGFLPTVTAPVRFSLLVMVVPTLGYSWFWLETYPQWLGAMLLFALARPIHSMLLVKKMSPAIVTSVFLFFVLLAFSKTSLGVAFLAYAAVALALRRKGLPAFAALVLLSAPVLLLLMTTGERDSAVGALGWNLEGVLSLLREPKAETFHMTLVLIAGAVAFNYLGVKMWRLVPYLSLGLLPYAVVLLVPSAFDGIIANFAFSALAVAMIFIPLEAQLFGVFPRAETRKRLLPLVLVGTVLGHNNFLVPDGLNLLNPRLDNHERAAVQLREILEGDYRLYSQPDVRWGLLIQRLEKSNPNAVVQREEVSIISASDTVRHRWIFGFGASQELELAFTPEGQPDYSPIALFALSGVALVGGHEGTESKTFGLAAYDDIDRGICSGTFQEVWRNHRIGLARQVDSLTIPSESSCALRLDSTNSR